MTPQGLYSKERRALDCAIAEKTGWTEIRRDPDNPLWARGRHPVSGALVDIYRYHNDSFAADDLIRWFLDHDDLKTKLAFIDQLFLLVDSTMYEREQLGRSLHPDHYFKLILATPEQVVKAAAKAFELAEK